MRTLVGWRAVYTDGTRYESASTKWADLPLYGLQVLFKYWSDGANTWMENHNGADCYYPFPVKSAADIPTKQNIKWGEEMAFEDFHSLWEKEVEFARNNYVTEII